MSIYSHPSQALAVERDLQERPERVVHIIDDDADFCDALAAQFNAEGLATLRYRSADHFLATYKPHEIECGILDLMMPGMSGLKLQESLRERYQSFPLIVVSAFGKTPNIVQAVRNGAIDFLEKPVDLATLTQAVHAALDKDEYNKQIRATRDHALWGLSEREREVLDLFMAAKTTIEIAHDLGISPKTVEKHRSHIYEKTNMNSIPELMKLLLTPQ